MEFIGLVVSIPLRELSWISLV